MVAFDLCNSARTSLKKVLDDLHAAEALFERAERTGELKKPGRAALVSDVYDRIYRASIDIPDLTPFS